MDPEWETVVFPLPSTVLVFGNHLLVFYVSKCFAGLYVHHVYTLPEESRRGRVLGMEPGPSESAANVLSASSKLPGDLPITSQSLILSPVRQRRWFWGVSYTRRIFGPGVVMRSPPHRKKKHADLGEFEANIKCSVPGKPGLHSDTLCLKKKKIFENL